MDCVSSSRLAPVTRKTIDNQWQSNPEPQLIQLRAIGRR
jgi:hypothetical protein